MTRTHPFFFFFRDPFIFLDFKTTFQFKLILGLKMLKKNTIKYSFISLTLLLLMLKSLITIIIIKNRRLILVQC